MAPISFPVLLTGCLALASLVATQQPARAEHAWWLDPVVTHTNGMRLASSTSERSHNVYWQCDVHRKGSCDCQMQTCCRAAIHRPPCSCAPPTGPVGGVYAAHAPDGIEAGDTEHLGPLTLDAPGVPRVASDAGTSPLSAAPPANTPTTLIVPPTGTVWLDSIQTIGQKMLGGLSTPPLNP